MDFRVSMSSLFICDIPTETMSSMRVVLSILVFFLGLNIPLFAMDKCDTHMPVVLFLTIILLLLNMIYMYDLNDGISLAHSEKRFIMYSSLRKREGNAIISPNVLWIVSRTLPIDCVQHCSSGGAPKGKFLRSYVLPDHKLLGMHIAN